MPNSLLIWGARSCTEKTPLADSENRGKIDSPSRGHFARVENCSLRCRAARRRTLAVPAESTCDEDLDDDGRVTVSNAEISLSVHHTGSNSRAT